MKVSRGVRVKPARKPPLLARLLAALDARPDVTVLTRTWPVQFVQLRYALEKTVINPDGFSPLHRETPLFYGQALVANRDEMGIEVHHLPGNIRAAFIGDKTLDGLETYLGSIHPEVAARLGLAPAQEREAPLTGRPMQR